MEGTPVPKTSSGSHRKAGYKSWKKKYRKMRIAFDQRMQEGEDIFKQEEKAKAMVKRIATENEYVSARALASSSGGEQPWHRLILRTSKG